MIIIMQKPTPSPTVSECATLSSYASSLITQLKKVQTTLEEASSAPDDAMILLREKISDMIDNAEKVKSNIATIKKNALNYAESHSIIPTETLNNGPNPGMA